ncbi:MAG: CBS domain-containing protein [Euryarchaeota archaeon]|nr:CBS domain-containing protein [Euryarchaeota archaeon]
MPPPGHETLLRELRERRKRLGLTQVELSRRAGVSQALVARLESTNPRVRVDPRLSTYARLLRALDEVERSKITARKIFHSPVISGTPEDSLERAARIMEQESISQMPLMDRGVHVGSIDEGTLMRAISRGDPRQISARKLRDIMGEPFPIIAPTTDLGVLSALLERHPAVLVQDKGNIVGIVTKQDIMGLLRR